MSRNRPLWWRRPFAPSATGSARRLIVVTDVDASLLEPGGRARGEETAALEFLAGHGIPLVINSSRTRAEIERVQQTYRLLTPFISEHGSALFVPHGSFPFVPARAQPAVGGAVIEFGRRYHEVVDALRLACREVGVATVGFAELNIEDVARELAVPIVEAQLAKLREYTEVFRVVDEKDAVRSRLMKALRRRGLRCWNFGAHQLATTTQDPAASLVTLKAMWREAWGDPLVVGIADSDDDIGWLRHTDVAVFVHNDRAGVPRRVLSKVPTIRVTRAPGRAGWTEAIFEIVGELTRERHTVVNTPVTGAAT